MIRFGSSLMCYSILLSRPMCKSADRLAQSSDVSWSSFGDAFKADPIDRRRCSVRATHSGNINPEDTEHARARWLGTPRMSSHDRNCGARHGHMQRSG